MSDATPSPEVLAQAQAAGLQRGDSFSYSNDAPVTRPDLDALRAVVETLATSAGGCGHSRVEPECPFCDDRMVVRRGRAALIQVATVLAAERARADQAREWLRDNEGWTPDFDELRAILAE